MAHRIGQQLGNYRLVYLIATGGFAEVYLGEHVHLGTQAAIKVLAARIGSNDLDRFRTEAQIIARLKHPHIVQVLEFGVEEETPYLVMEYASHGTLRLRHPRGMQLSPATILLYVQQVADALQYAHNNKVVHRDIKPENLLLREQGEVLLSDFGMAIADLSSGYQTAEEFAGTMAYMAPEQIQGHPLPASDQYSLGVIVYEWLCGECPFQGTVSEIVARHLSMTPPPLHAQVPIILPAVEDVVLTSLAKDPRQRFASVQTFAQAFEQACQSPALTPALTSPMPDTGSTGVALTSLGLAQAASLSEGPLVEEKPPPPLTATKIPAASQETIWSQKHLSRRGILIGLSGLTLVGGGLTWMMRALRTPETSTKTPSTTTPASTSIAKLQDSATSTIAPAATPAGTILVTFEGQKKGLSSLAWSPDGKRIASGGAFNGPQKVDSTVQIWDPNTGNTLLTYRGHSDYITGVAWSPDGKRVASASNDMTVRVWDARTGTTLLTYRSIWSVAAMAWSPDGTRIVSGAGNATAEVWDAATGRTLVTYQGLINAVNVLAWSPDGKRIASVNYDTKVQVWEAATGNITFTYSGHTDHVWAVAWSPDGTRVASGGDDKNVNIWDATTRNTLVTYQGHSARVDTLAWSPDSKRIVSGAIASDDTAQWWMASDGKPIFTSTGYSNWVMSVAWSPDGSHIAVGSLDGTARILQAG